MITNSLDENNLEKHFEEAKLNTEFTKEQLNRLCFARFWVEERLERDRERERRQEHLRITKRERPSNET